MTRDLQQKPVYLNHQNAGSDNEMINDKIISQKLKDKVRILVLEDNLLNQKLAGLMLKDWGFKYDIFANGKLAFENLKLNVYDLVLTDIQMPELNGYEAASYIRKTLKLSLPIIAMTAHALPGEREKCLRIGMTDYITKPIDDVELFNLLTYYLFSGIDKTEKI